MAWKTKTHFYTFNSISFHASLSVALSPKTSRAWRNVRFFNLYFLKLWMWACVSRFLVNSCKIFRCKNMCFASNFQSGKKIMDKVSLAFAFVYLLWYLENKNINFLSSLFTFSTWIARILNCFEISINFNCFKINFLLS